MHKRTLRATDLLLQVSVATDKIFAGSRGFSFVVGDEASLVRQCDLQSHVHVEARISGIIVASRWKGH